MTYARLIPCMLPIVGAIHSCWGALNLNKLPLCTPPLVSILHQHQAPTGWMMQTSTVFIIPTCIIILHIIIYETLKVVDNSLMLFSVTLSKIVKKLAKVSLLAQNRLYCVRDLECQTGGIISFTLLHSATTPPSRLITRVYFSSLQMQFVRH